MAPWRWLTGTPGTEQTDGLWFSALPEDLSAADRAIWMFFFGGIAPLVLLEYVFHPLWRGCSLLSSLS